jgi:hypothetical protein
MDSAADRFVHRFNVDGTIDSIRLQCFSTVATTRRESDLLAPEHLHLCEPEDLDRFQNWKRVAESAELLSSN